METNETTRIFVRNSCFTADKVQNKLDEGGISAVINDMIIPLILPQGEDHISDEFMRVMSSESGALINDLAPQQYEILAKIALARIANGAVEMKEAFDAELPQEYQVMLEKCQPAPMSQRCWDFFISNLKLMLENPNLSPLAAQLAFSLVECTSPFYKGEYQWDIVTPKDIAFNRLQGILAEVWEGPTFNHLNENNWPHYSDFIRQMEGQISWEQLYRQLNIHRWWQKPFQKMVKHAILTEG